jgi:hypothetical protein
LPTDGAGGFRTAPSNLLLLVAQSQAPDSEAVPLQADEETHAPEPVFVLLEALLEPGLRLHRLLGGRDRGAHQSQVSEFSKVFVKSA